MDKEKNKRFLDLSSSQKSKRLRIARTQNKQISNSSDTSDKNSSTTNEEVLVKNNEREIL